MTSHVRCNTCGRVYEGLTTPALAHMTECHARVTAIQDRERSRWRERINAAHRAAYWRNPDRYRALQNARKRRQSARERASA